MRIAMFTDSYKPQINGVVTSIEIFTEELRKKGHKVFIFAPQVPDYNKKEKDVYRVKSLVFSGYKEYRIALPFKLLATFPIERLKPDVMHIHSPFSMGVTGLALAKYYKIPTVGSFHTMIPEYMHYFVKYEKLQKSKFIKKIFKKSAWSYLRWFYNKCDHVVAPTDKIEQTLKRHGIKNSITVIPTGIKINPVKASKSRLREKYGIGRRERIILHVGRITKEKNIGFIINSLKGLMKKYDNTRILITSDGPYKERLAENVKNLGLKTRVTFTGYLPSQVLQEFYKLSDVFVMASRTETQGIVLLEAAMIGLPIVALDTPVIGSIIRDNKIGIASKGKNFSENVEKILYGKIKIDKIRNLACNYDIGKCTENFVMLYDKVRSSMVT